MAINLNDCTEMLQKSIFNKFGRYFSEDRLKFKDPLHEEMLKDTLLAANMLYDSLPESIADEINAHDEIMKRILIPFVDILLETERDDK